jgi:hypothetical protein
MGKTSNNNDAKVLILDIETAPIIAYVWDIWDQNIPLNMIKQDWSVLSWSAKWLNEPKSKVMQQDNRKAKNVYDDKELLKGMWDLLNEADVIITQNGKAFDEKKLNARFILNGMKPPTQYKHIDVKRIATKKFAFTSNKLEYMTDKLNKKYAKLKHKKFPGFSLWKACLDGNIEAWKEMAIYNIYDILSLEELYNTMVAWDTTVDLNIYNVDKSVYVCSCGNKTDFLKKGYSYTSTGKFQRSVCNKCGKQHTSKINLLKSKK